MKKKITKNKGAPTALGHDPLAWIDAEEKTDIVEEAEAVVNTVEVAEEPEIVEEDIVAEAEAVSEEGAEDIAEPKVELKAEPKIVCLEESLGIAQVEDFHKVLLTTLNQASEIEIDASNLQQVDGAGIQLLYVFIHDAQTREIEVRWKETSEALLKSSGQLGLLDAMSLS